MGLRVNTNIASITALRTLNASDDAQRKNLERLSTGLRINRASDDPSGLVISEQLRAQIRGIDQALENSQNARNLIGTAEAALNEVNSLLLGIRESIIFALNSGGNDAEQINAEQDSIDNAISSIDRIAQTTKFATRNLLDGSSGIQVTSQASGVSEVDLVNITFDGQSSQQYTINVTQAASQATLLVGSGAYSTSGASNSTIRITGGLGTQDIEIASSFTATQFDDAINQFTADTGIFASGGELFSVDYGSSELISLEVVTGTFNTGTGTLTAANGIQTDAGLDIAGNINGVSFDASGYTLNVVSDVLTGEITLTEGAAVGTQTFTVKNSGLVFQLNQFDGAHDREQVGISSTNSSLLGSKTRSVAGIAGNSKTIGGFLSSVVSGGINDLDSDAKNALRIVDEAIDQVTGQRAYLGAFQAQTIESNITSLGVAIENLSASESTIRDLDFAKETADFTRSQILFQSGISVLSQSNLISQSVLSLLG